MNNERINFSNNENFAHLISGDKAYNSFAMNEDSIEEMIEKEKANKFNNEVEAHTKELEAQRKAIENYQESIKDNFFRMEIKPLFNRVLVKPFTCNPFQTIKVENGIITDLGGMNPNIHRNDITGQLEERDQMIIVASVIEAGPECKYVREGDVVFYMKNVPTPVPFFKQGFWTIKEDNLIAIVNEGLEDRFKLIKHGNVE